jgi:hypothetical protein
MHGDTILIQILVMFKMFILKRINRCISVTYTDFRNEFFVSLHIAQVLILNDCRYKCV